MIQAFPAAPRTLLVLLVSAGAVGAQSIHADLELEPYTPGPDLSARIAAIESLGTSTGVLRVALGNGIHGPYGHQGRVVVRSILPGDIVVWWRESVSSWKGHVGFVHHADQGKIFTIEGNKSARVEGFDYSIVGMEKLLGFVRI